MLKDCVFVSSYPSISTHALGKSIIIDILKIKHLGDAFNACPKRLSEVVVVDILKNLSFVHEGDELLQEESRGDGQ